MITRTSLSALATLAVLATGALADTAAAVAEFQVTVPHHDRAMQAAIWYPAAPAPGAPFAENPVFLGTEVQRDAEPAPGAYPVVLLSHGLGGNYNTLQWLAAGLAERGALVVTVNHPNSSTRDFDFVRGLEHGTRAQDMSHMLDWLATSDFAPMATGPVMAAGFSFGGWTALSLGGVRGNLAGYAASCKAAQGRSSHCADIDRAGVDLTALDARLWDADYADDRVDMVLAIDPGLHWGLAPGDVAGLDVPVQIVGLGQGEDRLYATDVEASGLSDLLPEARVTWIAPAAHFSVLPVCQPMGAAILEEENDDAVCTDPAGTDRAAVHARILDIMAAALGL